MSELKDLVGPLARIAQLGCPGQFIPESWYRHPWLHLPSGKPHLTAILVLADLLGHYARELAQRSPNGRIGEQTPIELQTSYRGWMRRFQLTRNQVKAAVDFLKRRGLIHVEFRDTEIEGRLLRNVVCVRLVPAQLEQLLASKNKSDGHAASPTVKPRRSRSAIAGGLLQRPTSSIVMAVDYTSGRGRSKSTTPPSAASSAAGSDPTDHPSVAKAAAQRKSDRSAPPGPTLFPDFELSEDQSSRRKPF